jgi:Uma2 family endonuclease
MPPVETLDALPPELRDSAHLPDHLQLPFEDGVLANNSIELQQSILLTDSFRPVARSRHPDDQYFIGQDCGIYWKPPDPKLYVKAPDWYYVPDVPPTYQGEARRSYVLWHEVVHPWVLLEYVSGDGSEELDRAPETGKFWVYEHGIRPDFYGIYFPFEARIQAYRMVRRRFEPVPPNMRGHYPVEGLGVELGLWHGKIDGIELHWLRWWDDSGKLLLTGEEREAREKRAFAELQQEAVAAKREAEAAKHQADEAMHRAALLAEKLRALGVDPDQVQ